MGRLLTRSARPRISSLSLSSDLGCFGSSVLEPNQAVGYVKHPMFEGVLSKLLPAESSRGPQQIVQRMRRYGPCGEQLEAIAEKGVGHCDWIPSNAGP